MWKQWNCQQPLECTGVKEMIGARWVTLHNLTQQVVKRLNIKSRSEI